MDRNVKDYARYNSSSFSSRSDVFEPFSSNNPKHQATLLEWLNGILPDLRMPVNASDEEIRGCLIDGSVLCRILNRLKPGSVAESGASLPSSQSRVENVQRFLSAMDEMGLPRFQVADLEKGSIKVVLDCLSTLRTHFMLNIGRSSRSDASPGWKMIGERVGSVNSTPKEERFRMLSSPPFGEDRRKLLPDTKSLHGFRSPKMAAAVISHAGHKFHEVFQHKQGSYTDLPASRISEMMKSNSLDNAPTQSLLSVVNGILDESVEMKSGAIPYRVACLLRKVVQEIERRICTQAEHLRTQNNLFKAREEKYQSRIRVLEALATGTSEETQIVMNQLKQFKNDKIKIEEKQKVEDYETLKLVKENDDLNQELENLRQEQKDRTLGEHESSKMGAEAQELKERLEEALFLLTESRARIKELEAMKSKDGRDSHEGGGDRLTRSPSLQSEPKARGKELVKVIKTEARSGQQELENRLKETLRLLTESRARVKDLEAMKAEVGSGKQEVENRLEEALSLLQESRARVKELEEMKAEPGGDQEEYKDKFKEAQRLLSESRARTKELEAMQVEVGGDQHELEDRLKEALGLLTESKARIKELEAMKVDAGGGHQVLEDRLKEAASSLTDSRASVKELEAMKAEADKRQRELEEELKEALSSVKQLRSRVEELEATKAAAGDTEQELQHRLEEAVSSLSKSKARVEELEALRTETGGTQQELENKLKEAISSSRELRTRVKELEAMNTEARNTKQGIEDSLKEAVSSLAESRGRVKELESMKDKAQSTRQELENRLREAENLLTESRCRVKELEVMKSKAEVAHQELENGLKEAQSSLKESRAKVKELEASLKSKSERWKKKEQLYHIFTEFQLGALRELKFASQSIQQEIGKTEKSYQEEFSSLGSKVQVLGTAAKNYHPLLAENRKLHNELQELKGNIRVYCRIRPFLPGQKGKQSIIEYVGENGELIVANPTKAGKEGRRSFRFDQVYGPTSTQAQVFADTQPLIQSVLDGYNVCIFAYGQTGSGKTYTMIGPDGASEEEWGVNYRALNDLFHITQTRGGIFQYDISVQMVEIYNEQVRDLLSSDGQKKLGIMTTSQPNGLAVPDACTQPVNSTSDVVKLMDIGLQNRAKSSTAMNERSSRSHSIVSIHTRGSDLKSGSSLRGSLHLVDLAGSERVDRSEVTGDRLKEAQHINKSLSALGDVIFALSQKSAHVPYRNSKLTQVLQSSLGGHAKTLMFVQLNPDATSYSETLSTLKFAERVSGVELGAVKSNKDNREVRELMEQVATLKDTLAKKDEDLEEPQGLKGSKSGAAGEKRSTSSLSRR